MSRILVCNNVEIRNKMDAIFKNNGYPVSGVDNDLIVYRKILVEDDNYFAGKIGSVSCVGTWTYKGECGDIALELLYHDAVKENIPIKDIRKNLIGTYTCVVRIAQKTIIFVDETHTYAIYYYNDGNDYIITNTYYHIQKFTRQNIDKETLSLVLAKSGLSSNKTPIENIYRLMEDEYIEILQGKGLRVKHVDLNSWGRPLSDIDEAVSVISSWAEHIYNAFSKIYSRSVIFATGGLDSRLRLSLAINSKHNVELAYWSGSDVITNGTESDIAVNNQISEKFGLRTSLFDVSEDFSDCLNSINDDEVDRLGEYVSIYAHNRKWFDIPFLLKEREINSIELGYDPDILRPVESIPVQKNISVNELINNGCFRSGIFDRILKCDNLMKYAKADLERLSYVDKMPIEEAEYLFNYSRLDMGDLLNNYFNQYYYSLPLMYTKPLWDIINSVPHDIKEKDKLSVSLIYKWVPELMHVRVFSQNHFMIFDEREMKLKKTIKHKLLAWLKRQFIDTPIYEHIYCRFFQNKFFPERRGNDGLFEECISYLQKSSTLKILPVEIREGANNKGFDLAGLGTICAKLRFFDEMMK